MHITRRTLSAWVAPVLAGSATLLLASCGKPTATTSAPPTETNLVARVGNAVITLENFQAELNRRGRGTPARYATEAGRQELLDEMIRDQVLLERAKAAGLDRDPELLRRFDRMVIARFEETSKPATDKAALPTAAEIEQNYRTRQAEFATAEKSRAAPPIRVPSAST